jgi:glutamyl-Q tRNA(Asp) synthetase
MTSPDARPVFRFAPSPNGYLHLGHAYSALVNQKLAREAGGRLLLRIEDIDQSRCRKEYEDAIYEDLSWLGIEWETPVRRQSEHYSDYARALEGIWERKLVYPCFCSRTDITNIIAGAKGWPSDPDGAPLYPGRCKYLEASETSRWLASGRSATLRLHCDEAIAEGEMRLGWREFYEGKEARDVAAEPSRWGDAVVGRRDVPGSYHIACVIDDAAQGVTDVVRGMDLFNATSLHRLLQELLGLPAPNYHHHELILDDEGKKLSKSTQAKSVRSLREAGESAESVRKRVGF